MPLNVGAHTVPLRSNFSLCILALLSVSHSNNFSMYNTVKLLSILNEIMHANVSKMSDTDDVNLNYCY